jgi:hypothetical protein
MSPFGEADIAVRGEELRLLFAIRKMPANRTVLLAIGLTCSAWLLAQDDNTIRLQWLPAASGESAAPAGWLPLTFRNIPRRTRYTLQREDGQYVVKAQADASASGLIHRLELRAQEYRVLRWRWKAVNLIDKGDVTRKRGDDYPARVYVAFAYDPKHASFAQRIQYEVVRLLYGEYPPQAALNYIWDTRSPVGTMVPNPYTDRARMIVVESGPAHLDQWQEYERDIYADYRNAFGAEPPPISGIAIMTDADDTKESAVAYYGEISLRRQAER